MIVTNRLIKKLLFTLFAVFISNSAVAEWTIIFKGEDTSQYIDFDTFHTKGNRVKLWALYDYKYEQDTLGIKYLSSKIQIEYDCNENMLRLHYTLLYNDGMGVGQVVGSPVKSSTKWVPVVPGSSGENLWKRACKMHGFIYRSPTQAEWLKVFETSNSIHYIDPTTIYKNGQFRQVWQLIDYKQIETRTLESQSNHARIEYNCEKEEARVLAVSGHSGSMGSGRIILYDEEMNDTWKSVRFNPKANFILNIICNGHS